MRHVRSLLPVGLVGLLAALSLSSAGLSYAAPLATAAAPDCSALDDPILQRVKPSNGASLLTAWAGESRGAVRYGFTEDRGALFKASTTPLAGLVPVNRLYRDPDFLFTPNQGEWASAAKNHGYKNEGFSFYASPVQADCLVPVYRYVKRSVHRLTVTQADRDGLLADGWREEGVTFYAAPGDDTPPPVQAPPPPPPPNPGAEGKFSFAVVPDTQQEVVRSSDPRMLNRTKWLVEQRGLEFVAHTGDIVNWDTPDHAQTALAKRSMDVLEDAGIPYSIAIGNHDSQATGEGGSARDPARTYQLQRDTSTMNDYFKVGDLGGVGGAFEAGKIDNIYSIHDAGGHRWMVLTLEFCPRPAVVRWAKQVVADHPDVNVLISTHSYLNGDGGIDQSNQGYGDTSGQELFDQLVSPYPNVKMVFSGHTGSARKARIDTGREGNTIYSFLTTMHDNVTNPVRMFDIDAEAGTVKTRLYAPYTDKTWDEFTQTLTNVRFID